MAASDRRADERQAELASIRRQLDESRQEIRAAHDRSLAGVKVCAKLTAAADIAIQKLYARATAGLPAEQAASIPDRCVLVAHGGYGRRQLAPYSDIDLMVLYQGQSDKAIEQLVRQLQQEVFDVGLDLGLSVRSLEEAISLPRTDARIATSLIESRSVIGNVALYERFAEKFEQMVTRRKQAFCGEFFVARSKERDQYGGTVYLLEPNIKRSKGALRDLHLLRWLWFTQAGESDFDRLRTMNVISKFDHHSLVAARDFFLNVRNEMHFHAGKSVDALMRPEQVRLAEKLGYRSRPGMLAVERFMRDYFRHASRTWFFAARLTELTSPQPRAARVLGAVLDRNVEQDYRIGRHTITATDVGSAKLANRLDEALRLVELARMSDRRIGQEAWYQVYRSAPNYSSELEPQTTARFLDLLENPTKLGDTLRRLHELAVLEKIIPEFSHARCLLQFNQYHKYTVDEHCIRAVEEATHFADRKDVLGDTYRRLSETEKGQLHLALLIHDLGKGHEEDHSILGEEIARVTAERLGLQGYESEQLQFLVRQHLWMSHLAFRRDTNDPELLTTLAEALENTQTLKLLYLLTCADLAAVGPGAMNAWRVDMLTQLYERTRAVLEPKRASKARTQQSKIRGLAWQAFTKKEQNDSWFQRQFAVLTESLLASRSPAKVAELLRHLSKLRDRRGMAWGSYDVESRSVEFFAGVDDGIGRGVFSGMAGALSASSFSIFTAETLAMEDNLLLLRYEAEDTLDISGKGTPTERIADVAQKMAASIDAEEPPKFTRTWNARQQESQADLSGHHDEVRLVAEVSEECLIVEVFTIDRAGLLYELARAVHDLGLVIRFSKIGTELDQVVDVFYVAERDGSKPSSEERLAEIKQRLEEVIAG